MSAGLTTAITLAGGWREEAVGIPVGGGELRGNLLLGPVPAGLAALLLPGWGGGRSGPHGLLTRLARELAAAGIPSLRFDFRGRGEASGDGQATTLDSMGEDALAAAACLRQRSGAKRLLLVGICSGGNVGIGILDRLDGVAGLFLLSVYPFSDGDSFGRGARRSAHFLRVYWQKLRRPETWRKFRRGEIDFATVGKVLLGPLCRHRAPAAAPAAPATPGQEHLRKLLRERPSLYMIYGTADPDYRASRAYYGDFAERHRYAARFLDLPGANHNFYSEAWKGRLAAELAAFAKELR